jgi:hypothetical protein
LLEETAGIALELLKFPVNYGFFGADFAARQGAQFIV